MVLNTCISGTEFGKVEVNFKLRSYMNEERRHTATYTPETSSHLRRQKPSCTRQLREVRRPSSKSCVDCESFAHINQHETVLGIALAVFNR